jgi:hypothetical protein
VIESTDTEGENECDPENGAGNALARTVGGRDEDGPERGEDEEGPEVEDPAQAGSLQGCRQIRIYHFERRPRRLV